ncbi:hypothetical protein FY034_09535 [Trichlorobacter lovleyi]|uniref:hypothetical protein n=1 Tax=Trichlorobacter lovleyi TaxID=313985 RepID=UPI00224097B2|nr:hypothetical protein [Trichlorobacter lovleyi]QOX79159.1 hypothetical protein FY034_09535 [Trichlorobacter lovleyi]
MNKKHFFILSFVAALSMSYTSAFAGTISGATSLGGGTFSPSNKVKINVIATTTNYAACSGHTSGDRSICSNNQDPKLYWTAKTVGSDPQTVNNATDSFTGSGYTTL